MMRDTPSGGSATLLVWIGRPGSISGGGNSTFEICAPLAEMSPLDVLKGRTVQPAGTSTDHPAEPWYTRSVLLDERVHDASRTEARTIAMRERILTPTTESRYTRRPDRLGATWARDAGHSTKPSVRHGRVASRVALKNGPGDSGMDERRRSGSSRSSWGTRILVGWALIGLGVVVGIVAALLG
jgi:hypothetical protein